MECVGVFQRILNSPNTSSSVNLPASKVARLLNKPAFFHIHWPMKSYDYFTTGL